MIPTTFDLDLAEYTVTRLDWAKARTSERLTRPVVRPVGPTPRQHKLILKLQHELGLPEFVPPTREQASARIEALLAQKRQRPVSTRR